MNSAVPPEAAGRWINPPSHESIFRLAA